MHDVVLCDTTPLMTAIYSEYLFGDRSLIAGAQAFHRRCDLTLLTALDIDWEPDGLQRDGPQVRPPIDAAIRRALLEGGLDWSVVSGRGQARLDAALNAITPLLLGRATPKPGLFTRLDAPPGRPARLATELRLRCAGMRTSVIPASQCGR